MPVVVAWIGEMLLSVVGQFVLSALVSLGIGFASSHLTASVIPGEAQLRSAMGSAGPLVGYIGWFGIDQAITIILSAWAGRAVVGAARAHIVSKRASGSA